MTPEQLDAIRTRLKYYPAALVGVGGLHREFITQSREDIEALLAEVSEQSERIEKLRDEGFAWQSVIMPPKPKVMRAQYLVYLNGDYAPWITDHFFVNDIECRRYYGLVLSDKIERLEEREFAR